MARRARSSLASTPTLAGLAGLASLAVASLAACEKKAASGLPPANEWNAAPAPAATAPGGGAATDLAAPPPDLPGTAPRAGGGMPGGDPHAGLDMGGVDVKAMGLPPPDPSRPIDPSHVIAGTIAAAPEVKAQLKAGTALFLVAKRADASGAPSGPPLATEKLAWGAGDAIPFELTEAQAMIAGTQLVGDVVVIAHYDLDGDAISKQPGDVLGQARVTVPNRAVALRLDTVWK